MAESISDIKSFGIMKPIRYHIDKNIVILKKCLFHGMVLYMDAANDVFGHYKGKEQDAKYK